MRKRFSVFGLLLLVPMVSVSQGLEDRFVENMTAVLSAKGKCGFTVDAATFGTAMMTMGVSPSDFSPGGKHYEAFRSWKAKVERLTATSSQRESYCRTIGTNLSAFFNRTERGSGPEAPPASVERQRSGELPAADAVVVPQRIKPKPKPVGVVRIAQQRLDSLGYDVGIADGLLGPATSRAIKEFQAREGLEPDGLVSGELLQNLSRRQRLSTMDDNNRQRKRVIERTQFYLGILGLFEGDNDGGESEQLRQAIVRFQASNNISVDGEVSEGLLAEVKEALYD